MNDDDKYMNFQVGAMYAIRYVLGPAFVFFSLFLFGQATGLIGPDHYAWGEWVVLTFILLVFSVFLLLMAWAY